MGFEGMKIYFLGKGILDFSKIELILIDKIYKINGSYKKQKNIKK